MAGGVRRGCTRARSAVVPAFGGRPPARPTPPAVRGWGGGASSPPPLSAAAPWGLVVNGGMVTGGGLLGRDTGHGAARTVARRVRGVRAARRSDRVGDDLLHRPPQERPAGAGVDR